MAITPTAAQNSILMLNVAMFGQAAGTTVMAAALPTFKDGNTYAQTLVTSSDAYKILSPEQAFTKVINNLSVGTGVTAADVEALAKGMVEFVNAGLTVGATINLLTAFLYNNAGKLTNVWNSTSSQLFNKTTAASIYTLDQNNAASSTSAIANVTDQIDTTLTVYPDKLSGNLFNAPQAYTPGGNDLINTLQNDDVLTGTTGTTDTLNATLGNSNDNGGTTITPTLTGVEIINGKFDATTSSMTLDLQDSTGVTTINMSRVAEGRDATVQNIADSTATTLSVNNSFSPANSVHFTYLASALSANNNTAALTLNNVNTAQLRVEERGAAPTQGFETINLASSGSANTLALFTAEDLQTLTVTGSQNLTINNFSNVSGSFVTLNAGAATGNMTLNMYDNASNRNILSAAPDGTSSGSVAFALTTGIGADTVIINTDATSLTGIEANDSVDLGTGADTLRLQSNNNDSDFITTNATAQVAGVEAVQVFHTTAIVGGATSADVMAVRAGQMTGDQTFLLTDRVTTAATAAIRSTYNLVDLSAAEATAITITHSGNPNAAPGAANNGLIENMVDLDVATGVAAATVNIAEGVNTDPRFNFYLYTDGDRALSTTAGNTMNFASAQNSGTVNAVTTLTLNDTDTESNSVGLIAAGYNTAGAAQGAGSAYSTVNLTTGRAGTFLNLDVAAAAGGGASNGGVYGYDITGAAAGDLTYLSDMSATANQVKLAAAVVNASAFAGNAVVRVSTNFNSVVGAQSITMGTGADTVIFDNINDTRAGLTISDTVAGGTGADVLMIDGEGARISLGASEWTNVTGMETIRLVNNGQADNNARGAVNSYNLIITNELVDANAADGNRIAIVNDNGSAAASTRNRGVTIDGRGLSSTNNYSYDGQETTANTTMSADRFIFADGNVNGNSVIDGGADTTTAGGTGGALAGHERNGDVLEVRNAAVVTTGDLAGFSNVGTLQFTNDTAAIQTSVLQLNNTVIDAMVNTTAAADGTTTTTIANTFENMVISGVDNPLLGAARTQLNIDASAVTNAALRLTVSLGGGADTIVSGAGNDTIRNNYLDTAGTAFTTASAADVISVGAGNDTVALFGTVVSGVATTIAATASRITDFSIGAGATSVAAAGEGAVSGTDILAFSATGTNYALTGGALSTSIAAAAAGATVIQSFAAGSASANLTAGTDMLKLTTGVAQAAGVDTLQTTFNTAIGVTVITGLVAGDSMYFSLYDTVGSRMYVGLVNAGADSEYETGDVVTLIGTANMTAADYAAFTNANLSIIA